MGMPISIFWILSPYQRLGFRMNSKKRRGRGIKRRIEKKTLIRLTVAFILSILFALIVVISSGSLPNFIKKFNEYKGTYYPHDKERIDYLKRKGDNKNFLD